MLETRNEKCHAIIHGAATAAGVAGAGLAQLPFADAVPITAIQVGMIISLGHVFDVDLTEGAAKGLLAGFSTMAIGRHVAGALVGWIPVVGNAIKAGTAGALTEGIGWAAVKHFENLEQDQKNAFANGVNSAEIKFKEKVSDIFRTLIEEDNFELVLVLISYYITENYNNDIKLISDLFKNPGRNKRIEETINKIDRNTLLKSIKEYLVKMHIENMGKMKQVIIELDKIDHGIKKEKKEEVLNIINTIIRLHELDLIPKDKEKREAKMLEILDSLL